MPGILNFMEKRFNPFCSLAIAACMGVSAFLAGAGIARKPGKAKSEMQEAQKTRISQIAQADYPAPTAQIAPRTSCAIAQSPANQNYHQNYQNQNANNQLRQGESQLEKKADYPEPYTEDNNFTDDSEQMILARAIFGEGRREIEKYPDYLYGSARTIITRAQRAGTSVKEQVLFKRENSKGIKVWAYSCFNPKDPGFSKLKNPTKCREGNQENMRKVWEKCYELAGMALRGELKGREDLNDVTNYYVGKPAETGKYKTLAEIRKAKIPSWAFEMKNSAFERDREGYFIPRKPKAVVPSRYGNAHFYSFKHF